LVQTFGAGWSTRQVGQKTSPVMFATRSMSRVAMCLFVLTWFRAPAGQRLNLGTSTKASTSAKASTTKTPTTTGAEREARTDGRGETRREARRQTRRQAKLTSTNMTETTTYTTTATSTQTLTTTTSTTGSTTTTTPYCFESGVHWGPLDMKGTFASQEDDEFACQRKCLQTDGCSHFSFLKLGRMCHLQDRYAHRREKSEGFVSGPFQCWSYLIPGMYARLQSNHTYVPVRFSCMQVGVTWSPDLTVSSHIHGERDEVVFACQEKCRDTEGCKHFTVMFPGLCRLAGSAAVPLPAEQAISGPPSADCEDPTSDAPLGHTFMRKFESGPEASTSRFFPNAAAAGVPVALLGALAAALVWQRRRSGTTVPRPQLVDLEDSLQCIPRE